MAMANQGSKDCFFMTSEQNEEWRPISWTNGKYWVSSHGRVKSFAVPNNQRPRERILSHGIAPRTGHHHVGLYVDGYPRNHQVHRLVLEAFKGSPPSAAHVAAHLNGDPHDNRIDNLIWATVAENAAHAKIHGTTYCGERHHRAKLTNDLVIKIREEMASGALPKDIASRYPISRRMANQIRLGQSWRNISKG